MATDSTNEYTDEYMDTDINDYMENFMDLQPLLIIPSELEEPWGLLRLHKEAKLDDEFGCAQWCLTVGLLKESICSKHYRSRKLVARSDRHPVWWCSGCRDRKPALVGSVFEDANLSMDQVLVLALSWAHGLTYDVTRSNLIMERGQTGPINATIAHWFEIFGDRIVEFAENMQIQGSSIG